MKTEFDAGSYRDRTARVVVGQDGVFRLMNEEGWKSWRFASTRPFFSELAAHGRLIPTRELTDRERIEAQLPSSPICVLAHDRIPFVSYPFEWSFGMLREAALLHLEILIKSIDHDVILKDATPYNVQFRGVDPVFIDMGSFVELSPREPWGAYRQFCELMLFPLLLQAYRNVDLQPILRGELEGISASRFLQWLSWRDLFRRGVFTHGWFQAKLNGSKQSSNSTPSTSSTINDLKASGFGLPQIRHNLHGLQRLIHRLEWKPKRSAWTHYRTDLPHVIRDTAAKRAFVEAVIQERRRKLVWDLGCNDGLYSRIAANGADTVVAMDSDHACVERLFRSLRGDLINDHQPDESSPAVKNILPLCIDLANPSPGLGWRGRERKRLEERGRPDLVLCLGLIHHLVIANNIPLPDVIDWLADLEGEVILEFPSKRDVMVQSLLRNKHDQYDDYSLENLVRSLESTFEIRSRLELPSGERTLFHAVPRGKVNGAR